MQELSRCAAEIKAALRERRAPAFEAHPLSAWTGALDLLQITGNLAAIEHAVRHLHAAHPQLAYARNLCLFFDRLPAADGALLPFRDRKSNLQTVQRKGADTVLLAFCDAIHQLGMPLPAMHRWLGRLPASVIYLRDFRHLYYLGGIPALGADREASLAALRALVGSLGGRRIICLGVSAGGFAALHYGFDLGAAAVLSLGGPTNLGADFTRSLPSVSGGQLAQRERRLLPGGIDDLRRLYATGRSPPALLVHGRDNRHDQLHAENLAGLPSVRLLAVDESDEHNVVMALIRADRFEAALAWLLERRDG
jgi:hypothetical protein